MSKYRFDSEVDFLNNEMLNAVLQKVTSAEKLALETVTAKVVYDTTKKTISFYDGEAWKNVATEDYVNTVLNQRFVNTTLYYGGTKRVIAEDETLYVPEGFVHSVPSYIKNSGAIINVGEIIVK